MSLSNVHPMNSSTRQSLQNLLSLMVFSASTIMMAQPVFSFVPSTLSLQQNSVPLISCHSSQLSLITSTPLVTTIKCRMSSSSSSSSSASASETAAETATTSAEATNEESAPSRTMPSGEIISSKRNTEITKQLEQAKALLAVSRAKLEAKEEQETAAAFLLEDNNNSSDGDKKKDSVPFFAVANSAATSNNEESNDGKRDIVIKSKDEATGLFTTDGDLMAKLSEEEEWDLRPLLEVFETERSGEESPKSKNVDRDIAQSMYNLRKSLQTEDFSKIFDKRNRFIGDM